MVAAIQTDATVRVKGNVRQVFNYCADFRNAPDWLPGGVGALALQPMQPCFLMFYNDLRSLNAIVTGKGPRGAWSEP